jgi:hypothetical protein
MVHTVRVLGVSAQKPSGREGSFADAISWLHQGDLLYSWPRPDGPPDLNASWASASRMLGSFRMHWHLAGGYWPDVDVTYRRTTSWLPQRRIRFDQYVDHLCRMIGKGSTSLLLKPPYRPSTSTGEIVTKDTPSPPGSSTGWSASCWTSRAHDPPGAGDDRPQSAAPGPRAPPA